LSGECHSARETCCEEIHGARALEWGVKGEGGRGAFQQVAVTFHLIIHKVVQEVDIAKVSQPELTFIRRNFNNVHLHASRTSHHSTATHRGHRRPTPAQHAATCLARSRTPASQPAATTCLPANTPVFLYYVRLKRDGFTTKYEGARIHNLFAKKVATFSGTVVSFLVMITLIVLESTADAHPDKL
jgi:hypothetical protein